MTEREAAGDFDYLLDDDSFDSFDSFDAFDAGTWNFQPAPKPWYRSKKAMLAASAVSAAAVALVVSGVLLVFQRPSTAVDESTFVSPSAPTTAPSTGSATSAALPPPAPPPPPPEPSAAPVAPQPVQTYRPQSPTRTTKKPEIGVTRTPETRAPISVAPQRPGTRRE